MGTYAKTTLFILLLLHLDPFIGKVNGLDSSGAISARSAINKDVIEVKTRKPKLEVDTIRDYTPVIPNPKHDPPPRGKSATSSAAGGGDGR